MSRLVPAAAHGALSDADYTRCLRHYIAEASSRTWIGAGDTAPALVWDNREETTRMSQQVAQASSAPTPTLGAPELGRPTGALNQFSKTPGSGEERYRDQFIQLCALPQAAVAATEARVAPATASSPARAAPRRSPEKVYILVSEGEDEEAEGPEEERSASKTPASPPSTPSASPPVSQPAPQPAPRPGTHRRTAPTKAPRVSASTSPSPRPSTGSSVVFLSQPARKGAGGSPPKAAKGRTSRSKSASRGREHDGGGEAAGAKRQRSMEEFLYRGD